MYEDITPVIERWRSRGTISSYEAFLGRCQVDLASDSSRSGCFRRTRRWMPEERVWRPFSVEIRPHVARRTSMHRLLVRKSRSVNRELADRAVPQIIEVTCQNGRCSGLHRAGDPSRSWRKLGRSTDVRPKPGSLGARCCRSSVREVPRETFTIDRWRR